MLFLLLKSHRLKQYTIVKLICCTIDKGKVSSHFSELSLQRSFWRVITLYEFWLKWFFACCFLLERNERGSCFFKGSECDLRGPSRLSLVHIKVSPILWDSVLLLSHLHIIRMYNGDSLKSCWKTPLCSPFSVASRVCECFEMLKRSLAWTVGSMMLSICPISLSCLRLLVSVSSPTSPIHHQMELHTSVMARQREHLQWK